MARPEPAQDRAQAQCPESGAGETPKGPASGAAPGAGGVPPRGRVGVCVDWDPVKLSQPLHVWHGGGAVSSRLGQGLQPPPCSTPVSKKSRSSAAAACHTLPPPAHHRQPLHQEHNCTRENCTSAQPTDPAATLPVHSRPPAAPSAGPGMLAGPSGRLPDCVPRQGGGMRQGSWSMELGTGAGGGRQPPAPPRPANLALRLASLAHAAQPRVSPSLAGCCVPSPGCVRGAVPASGSGVRGPGVVSGVGVGARGGRGRDTPTTPHDAGGGARYPDLSPVLAKLLRSTGEGSGEGETPGRGGTAQGGPHEQQRVLGTGRNVPPSGALGPSPANWALFPLRGKEQPCVQSGSLCSSPGGGCSGAQAGDSSSSTTSCATEAGTEGRGCHTQSGEGPAVLGKRAQPGTGAAARHSCSDEGSGQESVPTSPQAMPSALPGLRLGPHAGAHPPDAEWGGVGLVQPVLVSAGQAPFGPMQGLMGRRIQKICPPATPEGSTTSCGTPCSLLPPPHPGAHMPRPQHSLASPWCQPGPSLAWPLSSGEWDTTRRVLHVLLGGDFRGGDGGGTTQPSTQPGADGALRALLLQLTQAAASGRQEEALRLALLARAAADPEGSPLQRIAVYLMRALGKRLQGSPAEEYVSSTPRKESMEAVVEFSASTPLLKFHYLALAHHALDILQPAAHIHIVDFTLWGALWPLVLSQLGTLPRRRGHRRQVKFTAVLAPPGYPPASGPTVSPTSLHRELLQCCRQHSIELQFQVVVASPECLGVGLFPALEQGDTILVNLARRLSSLADSERLLSSPKDHVLKAILQLSPAAVMLVDWDCDQQQPLFLPRVRATIDYFANIFDSLESVAPRSSAGRRAVEERVLAREMTNIVACEGSQRMARFESMEQLASRFTRLGFEPVPATAQTTSAMKRMLLGYPSGFDVTTSQSGFRLLWREVPIFLSSSWRPSKRMSTLSSDDNDFGI